jgi:hypothetical protein
MASDGGLFELSQPTAKGGEWDMAPYCPLGISMQPRGSQRHLWEVWTSPSSQLKFAAPAQ